MFDAFELIWVQKVGWAYLMTQTIARLDHQDLGSTIVKFDQPFCIFSCFGTTTSPQNFQKSAQKMVFSLQILSFYSSFVGKEGGAFEE